MIETELEIQQASIATDLTGAPRVGSDEFFYDIFGINIKGLKSIWTLLKRPAEYFEAASLPDWGGEHWPSIRIWLGLMGILIALQFVWAGENSDIRAFYERLVNIPGEAIREKVKEDGVILDLSVLDIQALGEKGFKRYIFIYPFLFISFMCALAFIFRAWKPATSFVIRLRFIFGIIIPGAAMGLVLTFLTAVTSDALSENIDIAIIPVTFVLYGITAYRGPFHAHQTGKRIGMSLLIALLISIFILGAQLISMLIAIIPSFTEIIETVQPQIDAAKAAREAAP